MKEVFVSRMPQAELTGATGAGYSKPEGIFMPDASSVESGSKIVSKARDISPDTAKKGVSLAVGAVAGHELGNRLSEWHKGRSEKGPEPKDKEELSPKEKASEAIRTWAKKTIFEVRDRVKQDDVEGELSAEAKKEEAKTPRPGAGLPEDIKDIPEDLGEKTPKEEPAKTEEPEPGAGGAGGDDGGSKPPDDRSTTPEPEDEGDDDLGSKEERTEEKGVHKGESKKIIDPGMFSNPEYKKMAEQINELAAAGVLDAQTLNKRFEQKATDAYLNGKVDAEYKEESLFFVKTVKDLGNTLSQQRKREEAEQRLISESNPDLELLRQEGPLYSKYGRTIENLWNQFREEMESGTFNKLTAEAKIEKIWNELNREGVGLPEIKEEDRKKLSDEEGAHRERLTAEFYVAQNLLSHEISKIYKKFIVGERREKQEDSHAESIRSLDLRHRQLDSLFEEMRAGGFGESSTVPEIESLLPGESDDFRKYIEDLGLRGETQTYENVKNYLYTKIEHVIDNVGFDTSGVYRTAIIDKIAEMSLNSEAKAKGYEYYGMALEYAVERIIGLGDVNALAEYPQFNLQQTQNLDDLIQAARVLDENVYTYLVNLKGKRQIAHSLFKNLKDAKAFMELVTRALDTGGFRFIEDEVGGISWMQNAYEQELGWRTGFNGFTEKGWLMFTDYREADDNVRSNARRAGTHGFLRKGSVPYGKYADFGRDARSEGVEINNTRKMRPWEVDRAFFMGRAMNAATQRRLVYTVMGDVNENVPIQDFIRSLESEFITNRLSPIKLVARRYFGGMSGAKRLFKHAQDRIIQRGLEGQTKKIYGFSKEIEGQDQTYAPYGYDTTSNVVLESGIVDPKSSHWRAKPLFLDLKEYRRYSAPAGLSFEPFVDEHITLIKYIDLLKQDSGANEHGHGRDGWEEEFNTRIRPVLENERLNLGILLSHVGGFNQENREMLWNKASELLPSRVASILPHDTVRIIREVYGLSEREALDKWDGIRTRLYMAEQNRVTEDSEMLRVNVNESGEIIDVPDWIGKNLEDYFEDVDLGFRYVEREVDGEGRREMVREVDDRELEVVRRLQALGKERASQLAQMHFPFTSFLDDVPKTGWENLGRTDLDRILVLDQTDMQEGYGQIVGLIANPAQGLAEVKEMLHTAVEKIKSPTSLDAAQRYVEPWLFSYLVMAARRPKDIATLGVRRLWRGATSEMQEFNKSTEISYEPEVIASYLTDLAKSEIIADDPAEAEHNTKFAGMTSYERLRNELKVRKRDVSKWHLYYLALILFTAFGAKALKEAFPED